MSRSGLTLIEMVLAVTILFAVVSVSYTITLNTLKAATIAEAATQTEQTAYALFDLFSEDLAPLPSFYYEGSQEAFSVSYNEAEETSEMHFVSSRDSRPDSHQRSSDLTEVGYRLVKAKKGTGFDLYRREQPFPDDAPTEGGTFVRLATVEKLVFSFYAAEKKEWRPVWEKKDGGGAFPSAVRIDLTLLERPMDEEAEPIPRSFQTTARTVP
jgi:type II secretion system protein J